MKVLKQLDLKNVVFIDIETARLVKELQLDTPLFDSWAYSSSRKGQTNEELIKSYEAESALYPEFSKIVCISVGRVIGDKLKVKSYNDTDEASLLKNFNDDLTKVTDSNPKTVFCGHAAIGFDMPFIFKRCLINQVEPHYLIDTSGLKPWEVKTIDTKDLWKNTSWTPTSLMQIAIAFGIPSPKDDISGADVGRVYWNEGKKGVDRITKYCEKDVLTTANVVRKCRFEPLLEMEGTTEEVIELPAPTIERLFNGGKYTARDKKELKVVLGKMNNEEKVLAFTILDSLVSNAKGKKTYFTKSDIEELRNE